MVSTKLTLIAILATTTLTAANYNGCAIINQNGICQECFERKVLPNGAGCGPAQPKDDKCLIYQFVNGKNSTICGLCKTGYASKIGFDAKGPYQRCVNATLQNCLLETDVILGPRTERVCVACAKDQYAVLNKTTLVAKCQNITNPVANCKWGSIAVPGLTKPQCIRCNDGYAVNGQTKQCDKTVGTGCWVQEAGKCIACNPFEGYSINANGTCFKTTTMADLPQNLLVRDALVSLGLGF